MSFIFVCVYVCCCPSSMRAVCVSFVVRTKKKKKKRVLDNTGRGSPLLYVTAFEGNSAILFCLVSQGTFVGSSFLFCLSSCCGCVFCVLVAVYDCGVCVCLCACLLLPLFLLTDCVCTFSTVCACVVMLFCVRECVPNPQRH